MPTISKINNVGNINDNFCYYFSYILASLPAESTNNTENNKARVPVYTQELFVHGLNEHFQINLVVPILAGMEELRR